MLGHHNDESGWIHCIIQVLNCLFRRIILALLLPLLPSLPQPPQLPQLQLLGQSPIPTVIDQQVTRQVASGKWQPLSKCALSVSVYLRWQFELAECCALGLHTVQTLITHIYSDYAICIGLSHLLRWVVPEQPGTECKLCSASCFLNQPHGTFWHCGLSKGWWLMSESSWRPLCIRRQPHLYRQINVDTVC